MNRANRPRRGFTLMELLVTIGIITILSGLLLPALTRAKGKANRIACLNNIRQVNLAATMYLGDHDGEYPARRRLTNSWLVTLQPYYSDRKVLKCPSDRFGEWRSYLMNGFNDFWESTLPKHEYNQVMLWRYPHGMKQTSIPLPSDTIVFGEKRIGSLHVHVDLEQNSGDSGQKNDQREVNHNMHRYGGPSDQNKTGGSDFAFADGSVRTLKYRGSIEPVNLWAITEVWRNAPVPPK